MKKPLTLLFFLPLIALAQPTPPFPAAATQTEVNAGVVPNKYVSPKTLANWSGAPGGAVTSIIAGTGISVDQATGNVTVTATGSAANAITAASNAASSGLFWISAGADKSASATDTVTTINATTANVTAILPTTNDGAALGSTSKQFSDLFLAEGGVINWDNGDATITQTNNDITVAGITTFQLGTSTAFTTGTIELGAASDTTLSRSGAGVIAVEGVVVDTISATNTLTNKRVTARSGSTTSSATPTINTDNVDFYKLTAQAADITSFTTNLSGTPVDGDQLEIRVTGTAARAITWGTGFVAGPAALPTTTVTTKTLYVYFEYDSVVTHWVCMFSGSLP